MLFLIHNNAGCSRYIQPRFIFGQSADSMVPATRSAYYVLPKCGFRGSGNLIRILCSAKVRILWLRQPVPHTESEFCALAYTKSPVL